VQKLNEKNIGRGVTVAKALGSRTRIKILTILLQSKKGRVDMCVKEIAEAVGLSHSATSHQLSLLADLGIVAPSRTGQTICYTITNSPTASVLTKVMNQLIKD